MVQDIQAKLKTVEGNSDIAEYLNGFFLSYDIPRATLVRLGLGAEIPVDKEFIIGNKMFCTYTKAVNLYAKFDQVQRMTVKNKKYRFVMLINDTEILALDTSSGDWLFSERNDIHSNFEFFLPLAGIERSTITEKKNASVKVGEKFAQFYNETIILNPGKEDDISIFLVNLVATLFSDSCGILHPGAVHHLIDLYSKKDGSDLEKLLGYVFDAIAGQDNLPEYILSNRCGTLKGVPQHKKGLKFDAKTRLTLISLCELNWNSIEPEVMGALIQAILNPEDASIAYNYTSTANVYKVIGPLFMDDLFEEYESKKREGTLTAELLEKLESIRVFDPACGTGNFLIICYKEMKKLEALIKDYCIANNAPVSKKEYVSLHNFYGIESNYIATEVCRIGLDFTERKQIDSASLNTELKVQNICNDRALLMDWQAFCPKDSVTYLVGNPPYKGSHSNDPENQRQREMKAVYSEEIAKGVKIGELDYATGYFYKATQYVKGTQNGFAFVTTNSLTQGIHVPTLWPLLFSKGIEISFAYTSFKWKNEGRNTTAVTVVIIGCRSVLSKHPKTIYDKNLSYDADAISPYLTKGGVIVKKENKGPISKALPKMPKGNMPYGKGLLLDTREKMELVTQYPRAKTYLKRVIGSQEFIHGEERWCLWISDEQLPDAEEIPPIKERIESVRQARLSGDKSAQKLAMRPHQFRETNMPQNYTLVIPSVSSENRVYMQIGYVSKNIVVTNLAFAIYDAEPWVFGLISSKMHNLWIRTVCGGLETRLRYSNVLGYNTFPVPMLTDEQKQNISEAALGVLVERENNSELSLMEMYNPDTMPEGLKYAHKILDEVVEECYRNEEFLSDQERLDEMFMLYKSLKEV